YCVFLCIFFFFSSRRRHTRSYGDWSSDVCSSDLLDRQLPLAPEVEEVVAQRLGCEHVERRERLVHEQDVGVYDERARKAHALARSEERRVGKECRSRGWAYWGKEKR